MLDPSDTSRIQPNIVTSLKYRLPAEHATPYPVVVTEARPLAELGNINDATLAAEIERRNPQFAAALAAFWETQQQQSPSEQMRTLAEYTNDATRPGHRVGATIDPNAAGITGDRTDTFVDIEEQLLATEDAALQQ